VEIDAGGLAELGVVESIDGEQRDAVVEHSSEHRAAHGPVGRRAGEIDVARLESARGEHGNEGTFDVEHLRNGVEHHLEDVALVGLGVDAPAEVVEQEQAGERLSQLPRRCVRRVDVEQRLGGGDDDLFAERVRRPGAPVVGGICHFAVPLECGRRRFAFRQAAATRTPLRYEKRTP